MTTKKKTPRSKSKTSPKIKVRPAVEEIKEIKEKEVILNSMIYLLPTESPLAIVQLNPTLSITSLLPKTTRTAYADFFKGSRGNPNVIEFEIELPDILWTQLFARWNNQHGEVNCNCFNCSFMEGTQTKFRGYNGYGNPYRYFVHQIDLKKSTDKSIHAAPFSVANTDDGYVCWGGISYPVSLRKAYNYYWQSVHNNSPGKYRISSTGKEPLEVSKILAENMKSYKPSNHEWGEKKSLILGTDYLSSSELEKTAPQGVFISVNKDYCGDARAFVGFAYFSDGAWEIKNKDKTIKFNKNQIVMTQ